MSQFKVPLMNIVPVLLKRLLMNSPCFFMGTAVEPPEVAAFAAEPPEVSVGSSHLHVACPVSAMEATCELLPCSEPAMEASYELLSCPEPAKEATSELSALSITPEDMACELPDYPAPATGAIQELPSRSVITMVTLN